LNAHLSGATWLVDVVIVGIPALDLSTAAVAILAAIGAALTPILLAIPFIGPFLALAVDVILAAIGIAGLLGFLGPLLTPFVSGLTFNMRWSPNPNRDGKPQVSSSPLSTVLTIRAKGKPDVR